MTGPEYERLSLKILRLGLGVTKFSSETNLRVKKHLSHLLLFSFLLFFDESLTKRESSSGRLLFLEIVINTNKSDTLKNFMRFYLVMFSHFTSLLVNCNVFVQQWSFWIVFSCLIDVMKPIPQW